MGNWPNEIKCANFHGKTTQSTPISTKKSMQRIEEDNEECNKEEFLSRSKRCAEMKKTEILQILLEYTFAVE